MVQLEASHGPAALDWCATDHASSHEKEITELLAESDSNIVLVPGQDPLGRPQVKTYKKDQLRHSGQVFHSHGHVTVTRSCHTMR